MIADVLPTLLAASAAAFALALLSAVAGFGGGVLLPVFTALFGLRFAVPMLTRTQSASNGSRIWLNLRELRWPLAGWFALARCPSPWRCSAAGPRSADSAQAAARGVPGRRRRLAARRPASARRCWLGRPLTTPFFLAYGLTRAAYIGTEAAAALTMHLTKTMRRTSRRHRLQCFLSSADADVPPLSQWWMLIRSHLHSCLWRAQCVAPVTFIDLGLVHATAVAALAERYGVAIEVSS